ncbi:MAG: glycosyltransferase [Gammaproteobacteria bacterium]
MLRPRIGLAVPSLAQGGGGVASVAHFLKDVVLRCRAYDLTLVSLATSANDECNLSITRPSTWLRGATAAASTWEGLPLVHVGAVGGEPEFRRYLPRKALAEAVADCDILQVVCGSPAYANALCGLGKPVSVQCATRAKVERRRRDARPSGVVGWWGKAMTEFTDRMDDRALRSADAIEVENAWMYEYAGRINQGRDVDLRYAPPGVDARIFRPAGERTLDGKPYVLCVGRLDDPRKNVELLLEAYSQLSGAIRKDLRVVLAGQAAPSAYFWHRADVLGLRDFVEFIHRPTREELVTLYQKASMFVLPSDEEGLGIVILEAMACGVPVVSTRSGGPDGVITEGEDGFLVPLGDSLMLAGRMEELHLNKDQNRDMGSRARATIERRFSEDVAEQAFLDIWDRLLQVRNRSRCVE